MKKNNKNIEVNEGSMSFDSSNVQEALNQLNEYVKEHKNDYEITLKEWKSLINKAGGKLVEQTSFHYYKFYRRIFEVKKWLKPKAFWLFVIEKK